MRRSLAHVPQALALLASLVMSAAYAADDPAVVTVHPQELADKILHNPGMGWVVYENSPLDQEPGGSSTCPTARALGSSKCAGGIAGHIDDRYRPRRHLRGPGRPPSNVG